MPWPKISLRDRRIQVRDDIAAHLPGADATIPNSVMRVVGDCQASLTHDNDKHLEWVAQMMMPDTAEGEFADRWASIWLPNGRKAASFSTGFATVTGQVGAVLQSGSELQAVVYDEDGSPVRVMFVIAVGVTLSATSIAVEIEADTAGSIGNLDEGAVLSFVDVPTGIDGQAVVAAGGLTGGADAETDSLLIERYIDVIQNPPHGGSVNDYIQWAKEVPGVTRAWAAQEMGIGTITIRFMMDDVRADAHGIPTPADVDLVQAHIDTVRPVTVADFFVVAPIAAPLDVDIDALIGDTPETRANIAIEIADMLVGRARPGGIIYASWISEAISAATGEDHHTASLANVVPASAGHIVVPGSLNFDD